MEVIISRGHDGRQPLSAKTTVDLGFDRRQLIIETGRSRPGLVAKAYVVQVSEDGHFVTRAFGLGRCGDFSVKIAERAGARATEKAVRELHQVALGCAEQMKAAALTHYGRNQETQAEKPT